MTYVDSASMPGVRFVVLRYILPAMLAALPQTQLDVKTFEDNFRFDHMIDYIAPSTYPARLRSTCAENMQSSLTHGRLSSCRFSYQSKAKYSIKPATNPSFCFFSRAVTLVDVVCTEVPLNLYQ